MATINIEGATVSRLIPNSKGFECVETYKTRDGQQGETKYTVWTDERVQVGQSVDVRGLLSTRLEEFTNEEGQLIRFARSHVNRPTVKATGSAPTANDNVDGWLMSNAKDITKEAPF